MLFTDRQTNTVTDYLTALMHVMDQVTSAMINTVVNVLFLGVCL